MPLELIKNVVISLLKKLIVDKDIFKNYQPLSNLAFVSKIIEKTGMKQLSCHMDENNLHASSKSAYRPQHSTETTHIKIQHYILVSLDNSKGVLLILHDLSAAVTPSTTTSSSHGWSPAFVSQTLP